MSRVSVVAPRKLVILAPNWLGDAVMALPAMADVRRAWPETEVIVAARKSVAPLFAMVPNVDRAIELDRRRDSAALAQEGFDAALLFPNSFASAWLVWRADIPERWGYAGDLRGRLLTRAVPRMRRYGHQVEYYQSLTEALGVARGDSYARIVVPDTAHIKARELLQSQLGDQPFVVFAPGAAYGRAKQWPPERFAELAALLAADNLRIVLVGARGDATACDEVARRVAATSVVETSVINLCGRTDLSTLAAVLTAARAVVANDSGAMHVAAAVRAKVTAVFGPTDDRKTAPLRAASDAPAPAIVATTVWCRPCMLRECPIDHRCMRSIDAARVHASLC